MGIKTVTSEYHLREALAQQSSTASRSTIRLRNIKNSVIALHHIIRLVSNVDTTATLDLWNFLAADRFWLNDNGSQITNKIEWNEAAFNQWGIYADNVKMYPKMQPGYNIGSMAFCERELVESSDDDCFGSRTIGKYNNPEDIVEFDQASTAAAAVTGAAYLDIWADVHNLLIYQAGDLRKYLL